jgi:hypothetical protein
VFGTSSQISSLALFGANKLEGLRRRPRFAAGTSTIHCTARNAWSAGTNVESITAGGGRFIDHVTDYTGFASLKLYQSDGVSSILNTGAVRRRLRVKTSSVLAT